MHSVHTGCLAVTCTFLQNDQDILVLHATAVTWGWNRYQNKSAQKVDPGEENSSAAPSGTQTHILSIMSPALHTTELSPLPMNTLSSATKWFLELN